MARVYYLISILVFILSSCAQVGRLTGGDKDKFAPAPIEKKIAPPNKTLNFSKNNITIPFDEFIKLKNLTQNIFIVPPHAKIDAAVKGKDLILSWDEKLNENTTYSIYLNGAVQDISEGNDSIIQYVFSTGNHIDTTSYSTYIIDAWSNKAVKNCVLALFDTESGKLINFAESDAKGFVKLNYVQPAKYKLLAFIDKNRNLKHDKFEVVGFRNNSIINISETVIDSSVIRVFTPQPKPQIRSLKFKPPGMLLIGSTHPIENESLFINNLKLDKAHYKKITDDSLHVFFNADSITQLKFVLQSENYVDTSRIRITNRQKRSAIQIKNFNKNGIVAPSDSIILELNDEIISIDKSKIHLLNSQDSIEINDVKYDFDLNHLTISFNRNQHPEVNVELEAGAIICTEDTSRIYKGVLTLNAEKKYGIINIDISKYHSALIIEVLNKGKTVRRVPVSNGMEKMILRELLPGEYSFRIIIDENNNGRWDTGNIESRTQAEKIAIYAKPTKVRANWEVDIELIPIDE